MPISTARGRPDMQSFEITDPSVFGGNTTLEYHRYVNAYSNQYAIGDMDPVMKYNVALFNAERIDMLGKGYANPRLWARLQRLGKAEFIRTFFKNK